MADGDAPDGGPPREYDAVFWDIGGVILDPASVRAAHRRFVECLVAEHGLDRPVDEALATWRDAVGAYFAGRDGTEYREARVAYARGIDAAFDEGLPETAWRPTFEAALDDCLQPIAGAREAIVRIDRSPLRQGIISDVDADEGRRILSRFGLRDRFDSITTSEEVGRTKPDPAVFEAALSSLGVEPSGALHVGDRYEHDMEGAARFGITTVAFGAEDGPAVDHRIADPRDLLFLLGLDHDADGDAEAPPPVDADDDPDA